MQSLQVHTPTLYLLLFTFGALAVGALASERWRGRQASIKYWIAAYVFVMALAFGNLSLFPVSPVVAVTVSPAAGFASLALMHCGLRVFVGRRPNVLVFVPLAIWGALAVFRWSWMPLEDSYFERRWVYGTLTVGYAVALVLQVSRSLPAGWATAGLTAVFAAHGLFFASRLSVLAGNRAPVEAAMTDFWLTVAIFEGILFVATTAYLLTTLTRERTEGRLREAAEIDSLTLIPNRATFLRLATDAVIEDERAVLALIDLDHFKVVNDTSGHPVGDEILRRFARSMRESVRTGDVFGRLGGEEFAILFRALDPADAAVRMAGLAACVRDLGRDLPLLSMPTTFSAGLAANRTGASLETLLEEADEALYRAKREGRDRLVIHTISTTASPGPNVADEAGEKIAGSRRLEGVGPAAARRRFGRPRTLPLPKRLR